MKLDGLTAKGGVEGKRDLWVGAALFLATLVCYLPALGGGFVWDDNFHVTAPPLRSLHGLWRIWAEPGLTSQYYPLLHSVFWLEYHLWGVAPFGYHLVNVVLHVGCACLFAQILRRLSVPGAWLAAFLFTLHPAAVESVAWIAEQKNTLSTLFYLAAAYVYLGFDVDRRLGRYFLALALFTLALLSKTVTATLPAALLVVLWWKRGHLSWRRDAVPLLPWVVFAALAGAVTISVEHHLIQREESPHDYDLTLLTRVLLAGRVFWHYLGTLVCPMDLKLIYPRWEVDPSSAGQWLPLIASGGLAAALWALRLRTRAPLAAFLLVAGSLAPVLGFFDVVGFVYSFVWDHLVYLPSLGLFALIAAGIAGIGSRGGGSAGGLGAPLVLVLAMLTWRQSRSYQSLQTLFSLAAEQTPNCWVCYNALGVGFVDSPGRSSEAIAALERAIEIKPDYADAHYNLARALAQAGRLDDAIAHYRRAAELRPKNEDVHNNLGSALYHEGKLDEAIEQYRRALQLEPRLAAAHNNLGLALARQGHAAEAVEEYREADRLDPDDPEVHDNLGGALALLGELPEASAEYRRAFTLRPGFAEAHFNLGNALAQMGKPEEAVEEYERAVQFDARLVPAHLNLGLFLVRLGKVPEAVAELQRVMALDPQNAPAQQALTQLEAIQSHGVPSP